MKNYSPRQRRKFYLNSPCGKKWPDSVPWIGGDRRIYAMWILGQDYKSRTGYYGSYPPNYLARVMAMFPDAEHRRTLHLFSGSLPAGTLGLRVDVNETLKPDVVWDAHRLGDLRDIKKFKKGVDLIIADPPYSNEDALRYGTAMIKRKIVLEECAKLLRPNGWIVWLDQALPMFSKTRSSLKLAGAIGIIRSTNHRFRVCTLFKKTGKISTDTVQ